MTAAFFAVALVVDLLAVICQPYCQPIARWGGATVLLFPVFLTYGALALPFAGTLALAFCTGLLWDALTIQIIQPGVYLQEAAVQEARLGWSILLFGVLAMMVHGLRPLFLRGRWDLHCLASGFCTVVILAAQYAMITMVRGGFVFARDLSRDLWLRMLLPGFFAMVLSPVVYLAFYLVANLLNYPVRVEVERRPRAPERL